MSRDSTQQYQSSRPGDRQRSDAATGNGLVNGAEGSTGGRDSPSAIAENSPTDQHSRPGAYNYHPPSESNNGDSVNPRVRAFLTSMGREHTDDTADLQTYIPETLWSRLEAMGRDIQANRQANRQAGIEPQNHNVTEFNSIRNGLADWLTGRSSASGPDEPCSDAERDSTNGDNGTMAG
ncbi:uncharacterized protein L203_104907 [Cryptococcus depauperatus CBS 7841]|uniref:Uncharacterized protein n=1 Tax=Cryptococcus depauperatus CBS 7841 TaxID=1295531 RepID=A0A1E3IN61_9TREE|nr:hypothetical protein L203_01885 [Cryptococcus depauperatus CBS 7841]